MSNINLTNLTINNNVTMSSLEIAELTEKRHDNVLRDIRNMLKSLEIDILSFEGISKDKSGKKIPVFNLPKNLTINLISGYDVKLRLKIINRLEELEEQVKQPKELSRKDLALMVIEAENKIEELERTKAYISDKKTATALGKIGGLTTANKKLTRVNKILSNELISEGQERIEIKKMVDEVAKQLYDRNYQLAWTKFYSLVKPRIHTTGKIGDWDEKQMTKAHQLCTAWLNELNVILPEANVNVIIYNNHQTLFN